MNTKEAIKFVEYIFTLADIKYDSKKKDEVISLLQYGEKYEKIIGDLEEGAIRYSKTDICSNWLCSDIKKLKQKYFPKPKETIKEVIK